MGEPTIIIDGSDGPTDHSSDIRHLRQHAKDCREMEHGRLYGSDALSREALLSELAADLLELHDRTGISLDHWSSARAFVQQRIKHPITENGV